MVQYQVGCKNVVVQPAQEYSLPDGAPWRTAELNRGRTAEEGSAEYGFQERRQSRLRGHNSRREKVNNERRRSGEKEPVHDAGGAVVCGLSFAIEVKL